MLDELPFAEVWARRLRVQARGWQGGQPSRPGVFGCARTERAVASSVCGEMSSDPSHHIASGRTQSSLPTMPVPKSAAISHWVGPNLLASSIYSPNLGATQMAPARPVALGYSARSPISASMAWMRPRRTPCGISSCAVGRGPIKNAKTFSSIVKVMLSSLAKLLPPMLRHIDLAPRPPPGQVHGRGCDRWNTTACRSTSISWPSCARSGATSRINSSPSVDSKYGVYDGRTFKADRFAAWLASTDIPWPRLDSGRLDLSGRYFPTDGKGASGSVAVAGTSIVTFRTSAREAGGRIGWPQSMFCCPPSNHAPGAISLATPNSSSALGVAARTDQAAAGHGPGLCGLEPARIWHRGGVIR